MGKMLVTILLLLVSACEKEKSWQNIDGSIWNTTFHVTYRSQQNYSDSIFLCLQDIDNSLSVFNDNSIVSRVNRNDYILPDSDFINVFLLSKEVSEKSNGAFDPTVAPLVELWGFGRSKDRILQPTDTVITELLETVGIADCNIDASGHITKKCNATVFNFSAIAKGYACDKVAAMFLRNGVNDFLVEIGGELRMNGRNPRNRDWVIQIDAPLATAQVIHEPYATLVVTGCGVATSGNYRNFYLDVDGDTLGHTINPASGYPVMTDLQSVTVKAPTAMLADALATACMVLGSKDAKLLIEKFDNVEALFIEKESP